MGAKITDEAKVETETLKREQRRGGMLTQCSVAIAQWLKEDSAEQQPKELQ